MGRRWLFWPLGAIALGVRPARDQEEASMGHGVSVLAGGRLRLERARVSEEVPANGVPILPQILQAAAPTIPEAPTISEMLASPLVQRGASQTLAMQGQDPGLTSACEDASAHCVRPSVCESIPENTNGQVVNSHVQMLKSTCQEYKTLCEWAWCQYESEKQAEEKVSTLMHVHWDLTAQRLKELNRSIELTNNNIVNLSNEEEVVPPTLDTETAKATIEASEANEAAQEAAVAIAAQEEAANALQPVPVPEVASGVGTDASATGAAADGMLAMDLSQVGFNQLAALGEESSLPGWNLGR